MYLCFAINTFLHAGIFLAECLVKQGCALPFVCSPAIDYPYCQEPCTYSWQSKVSTARCQDWDLSQKACEDGTYLTFKKAVKHRYMRNEMCIAAMQGQPMEMTMIRLSLCQMAVLSQMACLKPTASLRHQVAPVTHCKPPCVALQFHARPTRAVCPLTSAILINRASAGKAIG